MATYQPWLSERALADVASDLRRLARKDVHVDDYGHLVCGRINCVIEAAKDRVLAALWGIQAGFLPPDAEPAWLQAQAIVEHHREEVRRLRRETL